MNDPLKNRTCLYNRHRLSHQQIDRWLGEKRAGEFRQEKLMQLERARLFLQVTDKLREHQIDFVCLKGPLLSQRIYGDPTVRISHDIDLLVDLADLEAALNVFEEDGYTYMYDLRWPKEKFRQELLKNVTHHISLWNRQTNLYVEIHWILMSNIPLPPQEVREITLQNSTTTLLAGRRFTVLNKELELVFLIIHGTRHGWNRLKWLTDIRDYPVHDLDTTLFCKLAERFRAERAIALTNHFLKNHGGTLLPDLWGKRVPKRMIRFVEQSMAMPVITENLPFKEMAAFVLYSWHLFPGVFYKRLWLTGLFTRPRDLTTLSLNSKLAYHLYRPWSFIKRRLFHV
ncbi:MAG: nucleotidyltransferase family protein [Prolixibacteraceae bacterium]